MKFVQLLDLFIIILLFFYLLLNYDFVFLYLPTLNIVDLFINEIKVFNNVITQL